MILTPAISKTTTSFSLLPLWSTAANFPSGWTTILTGKSPTMSCLPVGCSDHWFGSNMNPLPRAPGVSTATDWPKRDDEITRQQSRMAARDIGLLETSYANRRATGKAQDGFRAEIILQKRARNE